MLVAEARPRPYASGVVAHGWNIDEEPPRAVLDASTPCSRLRGSGLERCGCLWGLACRAHCWVLRQPAAGSCRPGRIIRDRCGWVGSWRVGCFWRTRVIRLWSYSLGRCVSVVLVGCPQVAWWVRPLLENCIVDASIFDFFQDCDREMLGHGLSGLWFLVLWSSWFL